MKKIILQWRFSPVDNRVTEIKLVLILMLALEIKEFCVKKRQTKKLQVMAGSKALELKTFPQSSRQVCC